MSQSWDGKGSIEVELLGHDGNAFMILGRTQNAMRQAGATQEEVDQYHEEATSGDYDHLLSVTDDWVIIT